MGKDSDSVARRTCGLEAYPVKQAAYLSTTSIFIRRGNFAYDPMKGFLESPGPQGRPSMVIKGLQNSWIYRQQHIYIIYLRPDNIYNIKKEEDGKKSKGLKKERKKWKKDDMQMLNIMLPAGDCILSSPSKLREPIHICADELA
ncbi:hypothetical protein MGYG_06355 [Nannizzia gypsea CBS 118893]|uniref:Uncharacterized protein n=1 Tax=Arthroderma gypseum (strain ATCC MYA-4604 / CBS 118893) TaxID=535722 RepID=E4UZ28_ARTGP|nr:hypothetical protein MGYG_06355 [Nannizzia gypsea CBS 118893]EFR03358.1 hypothetical protein MGYG_06355 [Nannizzia gypsea CBS 118893]